MRSLLKTEKYINSTLHEFPRRYTGIMKPEQEDTEEVRRYRKAIQFFTKFDMQRTLHSLSPGEFEQLIDAMQKHEGWRTGREEFKEVKSVIKVQLTKRVISDFLIGNMLGCEWVSKKEAVALTEEGRLHAIVVHGKRGIYLRPEYKHVRFRELLAALQAQGSLLV